jgi:low temperature requirement protein LtrA
VPGRKFNSQKIEMDVDHMQERCGLFLLTALGETVLTTGIATESAMSHSRIVSSGFGLIGAVAIWIFAFGKTNELVRFHLSRTNDLIRSVRYSSNVLMVMVLGLICIAVANEKIIDHPEETNNVLLSLLLAGGPIIFLAAHAWYSAVELKNRPTAQVACIVTLSVAGPVTFLIPRFLALVSINLILIIFAFVFERIHSEKIRASTGYV